MPSDSSRCCRRSPARVSLPTSPMSRLPCLGRCALDYRPDDQCRCRHGIGRGDRVAIVLPNGPEMATAFVASPRAPTTAPLNPAYREDEFDFYLSDLGAKALRGRRRRDRPGRRRSPSGAASPILRLDRANGRAGRRLHARGRRRSATPATAGLAAGRATSPSSSTPPARPRGRSWCR